MFSSKFLTTLPLTLAGLGWLVLLFALGLSAWPILLPWLGAVALFVVAFALFNFAQKKQIVIGLCLIPICVLLTWEGGLFFLPSAVALIVTAFYRRGVFNRVRR